MKDKKNFYTLGVVLFVTCYVTVTLIACRRVELFGIAATASIFVYPLTYLFLTLFREKNGSKKAVELLNLTVIATLFSTLLVNISGLLPVQGINDGLDIFFNSNLRITLAALASFYLGENLHLMLYDYLEYNKSLKFLLAGTIAVTTDGIVFVLLSYIGKLSFGEMTKLFTGQYVFNVLSILIFTFIFTYVMSKFKIKEKEVKVKKPKKATTKKVSK